MNKKIFLLPFALLIAKTNSIHSNDSTSWDIDRFFSEEVQRLNEDMEKHMQRMQDVFSEMSLGAPTRKTTMPFSIDSNDKAVQLSMKIAGVNPDDIDSILQEEQIAISIPAHDSNTRLTIKPTSVSIVSEQEKSTVEKKSDDEKDSKESIVSQSASYGAYQMAQTLPQEVRLDDVQIEYKSSTQELVITLPVVEKTYKKIKVIKQ